MFGRGLCKGLIEVLMGWGDWERQQLDVLTLELPVPPAGQAHVNHFQLISDSSLSCGVPAVV